MLAGAPGDARAAGIPETVTRYPAPQPSARVLTIAGPTDTPVVAPLIQGFQSQRPDVNVVYREMGSRELYEAMIAGELKDVDVLMSSAADLQIRLANDGYAQRCLALRRQAAVVGGLAQRGLRLHLRARRRHRLQPQTLHRGHGAAIAPGLLRALERDKDKLHGRVGTYDISASSVGYLMAEQDELVSSNFWGLANAFGQVGVRLAATSAEILDAIERDELDLGYNMLGPTRCRARPPAATSAWSSRRTMCWCWRARC